MTKGGTKLVRDAACPFCALACDDLVIERSSGAALSVRENGCDLSRQSFARAKAGGAPEIAGKPASLDDAVAQAARLLGRSRAPLFAGMAADVAGVRAALKLAERIGAVVDDLGSDGLFRNLRVLQDSGWMTTTLSEIRNRMDTMLIVGPDPAQAFPRFYERCVLPVDTTLGTRQSARRLFRLGAATGSTQGHSNGVDIAQLPFDDDRLPAVLAALRALVNGKKVPETAATGLAVASLTEIADALRKAEYGVVVWSAAAFSAESSEMIVQVLVELVRDLNRTTRCSGFPLGGNDNLIGANQACTWQYGLPLRTSFAAGIPIHDPVLNSARRRLAATETDAVVWVSAFRDQVPSGLPTNLIALAPPGTKLEHTPAVQIPIGTPGLDHAGQIFRMDSVVALPLHGLLQRNLPSAADVLGRIFGALAKEQTTA